MNRTAIYLIFDRDGVVDDYVYTFLDGLVGCLDRLLIISNGALRREDVQRLGRYDSLSCSSHVLIRGNVGFDAGAFRDGIAYIGWDELHQSDELILINDTVMGPVYPFEKVFEKMDAEPIDFWGLTEHYGAAFDFTQCNPYGFIPKHVQTYFIAFRKKLLQAPVFRDFWERLPPIDSYVEAIGKYETYLTKYFEDAGFSWSVCVKTDDLATLAPFPLIDLPVLLLSERNCPVFKRKTFFDGADIYFLRKSDAEQPVRLFEYLKNQTDFDTDLIIKNILRTCYQADYYTNLGLIQARVESDEPVKGTVAVFIHLGECGKLIDFKKYEPFFPEGSQFFEGGEVDKSPDNLYTGANAKYSDFDHVCVIAPERHEDIDEYGIAVQTREAMDGLFGSTARINGVLKQLDDDKNAGMATTLQSIAIHQYLRDAWSQAMPKWFSGFGKMMISENKLPQGSGIGIYWLKTSAAKPLRALLGQLNAAETAYGGELFEFFLSVALQSNGFTTLQLGSTQDFMTKYSVANAVLESEFIRGFSCGDTSILSKIKAKLQNKLPRRLFDAVLKMKRVIFKTNGAGRVDI